MEDSGAPAVDLTSVYQALVVTEQSSFRRAAVARGRPHQDARLELEGKAASLLASVR